jgi:ribosome-associated toxin RatA of RatAB toxin-antitoxin module
MKWVYWIAGTLVGVVGLVALTGVFLPVNHEASRSAEFARTSGEVYALVSDFRNYPNWWPDITKIEMMVEQPTRTTFREYMADGPVIMTVVEATPPSRFVTTIDDKSQPFGGTWTFEVAPVAEGRTRLTITERGEIYNPIFRALARFVFGYTSTMESFLRSAQNRLGSS